MKTRFPLPKLKNDLLLRVINHLPVERVPVWMMRQAGRTDPLYRKIRETDSRPLEILFQDVSRAVEISLLPQRLGVDAIIMFQDILTPLIPMGARFYFHPGPILDKPIRNKSQILALRHLDPPRDVPFVGTLIRGITRHLQQALPILGFSGSPTTLAFFMCAGKSPGKNYSTIFRFIEEQPAVFQQLLEVLTTMTIDYLNYQIECGVHAVQLFESFGDVIPRKIYEEFVQPTHERIFSELHSRVPAILFVKESEYLDLMLKSGAKVLSVGRVINLKNALQTAPNDVVFQGNVDNRVLLEGNHDAITKAVQTCYEQTGKQRLILNLNHGLLADTPFENVRHFVRVAQSYGRINDPVLAPTAKL